MFLERSFWKEFGKRRIKLWPYGWKNPLMMFVLGDFNKKSNSCYTNDRTNFEGSKIDFSMSSIGFHKIINKLTHIWNSSSSCIDLLFTTEPHTVMESGVHSSLHANCYHQLRYVKFDLNVLYPPPYEPELWHYKLSTSDCNQKGQLNILIAKSHFCILLLTKKYDFLRKSYTQFYSSRDSNMWR